MGIQPPFVRRISPVTVVIWAIALPGCTTNVGVVPDATMQIMLAFSADLGCVRSGSEPVSRIVQIRNSSSAVVRVSRWTVSCECLTIEPASIDVEPAKSTYVRLVFDPTKESDSFVGDLRIIVDGFAGDERVCSFDVPVSVIAPGDVKHLDGLGG